MKLRALPLFYILLSALVLLAPQSRALHVTAGWTEADVGLVNRGNGFYAGVQESWPIGTGLFDFSVAGEYLQKVGSLTRTYTDPHSGLTTGEAEVKLHCFQPALFVGLRVPVSGFSPRLYSGASVVLNLKEVWDEPEGETDGEYNYENMDFQVHLGLSFEFSRFMIDARYSSGLLEQVIDRTSNLAAPNKAEAPELPENGAKINSWQVGVGLAF